MNRGSLAARLLAAFLEELDEQLRAMDADLLALEAHPADGERLRSLFRVAHTVKGAARAAAVPVVEDGLPRPGGAPGRGARRRAPAGRGRLPGALLRRGRAARGRVAAGGGRAAGGLARGAAGRAAARARPRVPGGCPRPRAASAAAPAERGDGRVRVEEEKLDALLASAVQLVASRGRIAARVAGGRRAPRRLRARRGPAPAHGARGPRRPGARRRTRRRGRGLAALDEELRHASREAARLASEAAAEARELGQVTDELTDRVRRLRLRPFADACEALPRVARDVAAASGKEVRLTVRGGEVEADRGVMDGLREALLHLVRNAVDHGIEPPDEREARGKPRAGTLVVSAALHRERMTVTVEDDGRGIDTGAVRAALERRGLPRARRRARAGAGPLRLRAQHPHRGDPHLRARRGAGRRARRRRARPRHRGRHLDLRRGTTFMLETPLALATLRALLVRVGDHLLALPTAAVDALVRIRPEAVHRADGRDVAVLDDVPVQVASLARILGPPLREARRRRRPAGGALLRAGEPPPRRGGRRARRPSWRWRVRPLERPEGAAPAPGRRRHPGHRRGGAGAQPRQPGGGRRRARRRGAARGHRGGAAPRAAAPRAGGGRLHHHAHAGAEHAGGGRLRGGRRGGRRGRLARLQERGADLVVTDVEMPRMDGIELCEAIRASRRFAALPVVLVTSLDSAEHRARGLEAGADAYIGKAGFDQQGLLEIVRQLVG